jgi:hypothetical protein
LEQHLLRSRQSGTGLTTYRDAKTHLKKSRIRP